MWVRHKCTICKGTGIISLAKNRLLNNSDKCVCLTLPNYMELFPNADWRDTTIGLNTPAKVLIYASCDEGCLLIDDYSNVTITGVGTLRESMTPRTLEELNNLCEALRLKILW